MENSQKNLVQNKKTLPLGGNREISFDKLEIFSRDKNKISSQIIDIKKLRSLSKKIKTQVVEDIKKIISKRKFLNKKKTYVNGCFKYDTR
jgi:dihydropteroate synthase